MNRLMPKPRAVIFDVGNVLLDWNPHYLYRKIFRSEDERRWFLTHVCSAEWHARQDQGRPCREAVEELCRRFPGYEDAIAAFYDRWLETIRGPIAGSVEILETLKAEGVPVFALSNFSAELWDRTVAAHPFLSLFDDRILSGEVGVNKPCRRIYDLALDRIGYAPQSLVFIDDKEENLATAQALGLNVVLFETAALLAQDLAELGLPVIAVEGASPVPAARPRPAPQTTGL